MLCVWCLLQHCAWCCLWYFVVRPVRLVTPRVCVVCFLFIFYLSVYVYFARCVFRVLFHIHNQLHFSNSICTYVTVSIHVHKTFCLYLSFCPPKQLFIRACLRQDCSIKIKRIARHWQFRTHMSIDSSFLKDFFGLFVPLQNRTWPSPPLSVWSAEILFQNFQIFYNILLNWAIFVGGVMSKSMQIPNKRIETVGNHVETFWTC